MSPVDPLIWPGRLPLPPSRPGQTPPGVDLWAQEIDAEMTAGVLLLVEAERSFLRRGSPGAAASFVEALLEVVDLFDLTAHRPVEGASAKSQSTDGLSPHGIAR